MKVFSKNHKNNKSSPALQSLFHTSTTGKTIEKKPKGINKIKTFKQILTQNIHGSNNTKSATKQNELLIKQNKNKMLQKQNSLLDVTIHNNLILSQIKMINSIQKSIKTTRQYRLGNTSSSDKIQSIIYYGNKSKQITPFQNNFNSKFIEQDKIKKSIDLNLSIISNQSNKENQENLSSRSNYNKYNGKQNNYFNENSNSKQFQFKKINHYKNTRVNYNHQAIVKKWGLKDFRIGKRLGKGRFGQVHLVEQKQSGLIFAMKKIDIILVKQQDMQNQIIEQIKLQLYLNHPNILKMYGFFKEGNDLCMILQYAQQKCLFNKLNQKIDEKNCHYYILQMIKALKYCHQQFVLHRDLKPENILISFGVAKLADFGWAAYAPKYKRMTFCGTLDYVSPQILKGQWYDERVDIWSLGVLIYELSTGRAPFQSNENNHAEAQRATMNRILKCDFSVPQTLSFELQKLIESILNSEPEDRPTLSQIECCLWMTKFKEEGLEINKKIWQFWNSICEK